MTIKLQYLKRTTTTKTSTTTTTTTAATSTTYTTYTATTSITKYTYNQPMMDKSEHYATEDLYPFVEPLLDNGHVAVYK